jgi:hypothetical protein
MPCKLSEKFNMSLGITGEGGRQGVRIGHLGSFRFDVAGTPVRVRWAPGRHSTKVWRPDFLSSR